MSSIYREWILTAVLGLLVCRFGIRDLRPVALPICEREICAPVRDEGPAWAEFIPHDHRIQADISADTASETLLMVSVQDTPRHATEFVVSVEEARGKPGLVGEWHRVEAIPAQPDYPLLPPCPPATNITPNSECPQPSDTGAHESWFLPMQRKSLSNGLERDVVTTQPVLTYGRVRVVLDETVPCDAARWNWCRSIATRLNNVLIPRVESVFGPVADRLETGLLTVVVTPQVRNAGGNDGTVKAFVLSTDFRVDLDHPQSHACDAIYIDTELDLHGSDAILTHELTHAAQFCGFRRRFGETPWPLQDWMIEGTAHAAEVVLTHIDSNVTDRLRAFHQSPEQSPLVVTDATVSGRWRDPRCRGATCSFFTWIAQHYGLETIAKITESVADSADPWRSATGQPWREIQRAWLIFVADSEETHCHRVIAKHPLTLRIDGGATAFLTLPSTDGNSTRLRLVVESHSSVPWRAVLLRKAKRAPADNQGVTPAQTLHSGRTALASPVMTFR